jgi:hypothetical protein
VHLRASAVPKNLICNRPLLMLFFLTHHSPKHMI